MRGMGSDHVISGPKRGLKNASDGTHTQTDYGYSDSKVCNLKFLKEVEYNRS